MAREKGIRPHPPSLRSGTLSRKRERDRSIRRKARTTPSPACGRGLG
ncbi:MAG: hypothetical protein OJF62_000610 [Pseudolabrys sp.]|nr:hypothetical protein [Pseudolabrys sp.]